MVRAMAAQRPQGALRRVAGAFNPADFKSPPVEGASQARARIYIFNRAGGAERPIAWSAGGAEGAIARNAAPEAQKEP